MHTEVKLKSSIDTTLLHVPEELELWLLSLLIVDLFLFLASFLLLVEELYFLWTIIAFKSSSVGIPDLTFRDLA